MHIEAVEELCNGGLAAKRRLEIGAAEAINKERDACWRSCCRISDVVGEAEAGVGE